MFETVDCPYCGHENDMTDALCDGCPSDNKMDWECENCEKEFEVYIEFRPTYTASKIEYTNCGICDKRIRDIYKIGRNIPFPKSLGTKEVCHDCFVKALFEDYENEKK